MKHPLLKHDLKSAFSFYNSEKLCLLQAGASAAPLFIIHYVHRLTHRYLSNIDCLKVHTASLICFICTVNGRSKIKNKKKPWKKGASIGHITNLKQSILETFDIYGPNKKKLDRGSQYLKGENLKVVWAEFSTLSQAVWLNKKMRIQHKHSHF